MRLCPALVRGTDSAITSELYVQVEFASLGYDIGMVRPRKTHCSSKVRVLSG
jgi:hypothetical protein